MPLAEGFSLVSSHELNDLECQHKKSFILTSLYVRNMTTEQDYERKRLHELIVDSFYALVCAEQKKCPKCNFKVPPNEMSCPNCGYIPPIPGGFLTPEENSKSLLEAWKWDLE